MKRGIAMSTLLVIIIAMIILLSVATVSTVNISNTSKKLAFASELQMIQESVDSYRTKNDGAYPVSDFVNIDISSLDEATKLQFINNNEDIVNNNLSFRKLDLTKLSLVSITRGKTENNDIYVVSEKTGIVYYAKGEIIGSNTYYSMTQELKKLLNYNKKSDEVLTDNAVIFDISKNEFTNENVTGSIKVPKEYTNVVVKVGSNTVNVNNLVIDEKYNVYNVEVDKNCLIEVEYQNTKGVLNQSSYRIKNIDKAIPTINVESIDTLNGKKYINLSAQDNLSGIKSFKYDVDKIDNNNLGKIYFNNGGTDISNDFIVVDAIKTTITIYVEDNAGNYNIILQNI